jgi:hypothetical protein
MLWLLNLIPVVGTIANGITNYLSTRNELKMSKDKNDLEEIKIRLDHQRKDIRLQIQQDMIVFPVAFWTMLFTWKQIVSEQYPDLVWEVAKLEPMIFIPVLAYLFGLPIRNYFNK